ncbi:MAG TPA: hypothetical protein VIU15_23095 [Streptomyces sp.]
MRGQDSAARPGIAPGARHTAGTMFAALYGTLVPYPWHDPEHDAYQLFYQRSLAMGWLDDAVPGLWAMNDAGWGHPLAAPASDLVSWFQVEASAVPGDRPLPVQPFLRCAWDVTERIGRVRLTAVQVLVPVQGIDAASRPPYATVPSVQTTDWFGEGDPGARTAVKVRIDSGCDPSAADVAQQLAHELGVLEQDVFVGRLDDSVPLGFFPAPPFDDGFWNGPPLHGMSLSGELVEWSGEAVGWLAEVVADAAARLGVRAPLLLTAVRA